MLTNTVGKPIYNPEIVYFDQMWNTLLMKLHEDNYNFTIISKSGMTSKDLITYKKEIFLYKPDIVILQLGVVDSAPRALRKNELMVIRKLGRIGKLIHRIIRKHYLLLTKLRDISYTNKHYFQQYIRDFKESLPDNVELYFIEILKPSSIYLSKTPLVLTRNNEYNKILSEIMGEKLIKPFEHLSVKEIDRIVMADGYHLNKTGNEYSFDYINKSNMFK